MVNKPSFTKKLLSALKLLLKKYPHPERAQLHLLFIPHLLTILSITSPNLHTLCLFSLSAINSAWRCHPLPVQLTVHWAEYEALFSSSTVASFFSWGFAAWLQVWKEVQFLLLPNPSHMLNLLLLLHLNLTLQGFRSNCFLQTDLCGQTDEELMPGMKKRYRLVYIGKRLAHVEKRGKLRHD